MLKIKKINQKQATTNTQNAKIVRGQSLGNRINQLVFEKIDFKAIKDRCIQIKNIFVTITAMLFVIGVNLGALMLVALAEDPLILAQFLAIFR